MIRTGSILFFVVLISSIASKGAGLPPSELFKKFIGEKNQRLANESFKNDLAPFIRSMESNKGKNELRWLKKVYRATHKNFLKEYQPYAAFEDIFTYGKYDCLTGTSLYALIFESLNINFKIYETNYHIFILLETSSGDVLIESTDPLNGFISNKKLIAQKLVDYKLIDPEVFNLSKEKTPYDFKRNIFRETSLHELVGLMHFNTAVRLYNEGNLLDASLALIEATAHYHSQRIDEFVGILILSILNSDVSEPEKKECLRNFKNILDNRQVASLN